MRNLAAFMASVAAAALLLSSCGSSDDAPDAPRRAHSMTRLADPGDELAFTEPVTLRVHAGQIDSAEVMSDDAGQLEGQVGDGGDTWASDSRPEPGSTYQVSVTASDRFGRSYTFGDEFAVASVPDGQRLTLAMQPSNESVVGVGAPIIVHFDQAVTEREAVERAMQVSSDPQVVGSWHWVNNTQARFRPKEYWPAGTNVALDIDVNGVRAGEDLWGGRSYHLEFEVGAKRVAKVNADRHTFTVNVDGKTKHTWDTSLGAPDFATRNGTYVVLEKFEERNMTSCNANITCDESDPDYYDVDTEWSVRLTYSGTFVHSAPWSVDSQGDENVSHGCINLNEGNAETYFKAARYGDIVTVTNSTREAGDLVNRGDPGMVDWNQSWNRYVRGSALDKEVTTGEL